VYGQWSFPLSLSSLASHTTQAVGSTSCASPTIRPWLTSLGHGRTCFACSWCGAPSHRLTMVWGKQGKKNVSLCASSSSMTQIQSRSRSCIIRSTGFPRPVEVCGIGCGIKVYGQWSFPLALSSLASHTTQAVGARIPHLSRRTPDYSSPLPVYLRLWPPAPLLVCCSCAATPACDKRDGAHPDAPIASQWPGRSKGEQSSFAMIPLPPTPMLVQRATPCKTPVHSVVRGAFHHAFGRPPSSAGKNSAVLPLDACHECLWRQGSRRKTGGDKKRWIK